MKRILVIVPFAAFIAFSPVSAQNETPFSQAELDQMLAPIALYSDPLLAQILIASTYPLEVVEAARWLAQRSHLQGEAAVAAAADQDWDPSVKALLAFPRILAHMNEDLSWTRNLGEAFLVQPLDVMETIQDLRAVAHDGGYLQTSNEIRVIRERDIFIIEPAQAGVLYIPYYNPHVVFGRWIWPTHPPVVWAPPSHQFVGTRIIWVGGIRVTSGLFVTDWSWHRRQVVIVNNHHHHHHHTVVHNTVVIHRPPERIRDLDEAPPWRHDPYHRRGVRYRNESLEREYGRTGTESARDRAEQIRRQIEETRERGSGRDRDGTANENPWDDRRGGSETGGRGDVNSERLRDRDTTRSTDTSLGRGNRPTVSVPEQDNSSVQRPTTPPDRPDAGRRDRESGTEAQNNQRESRPAIVRSRTTESASPERGNTVVDRLRSRGEPAEDPRRSDATVLQRGRR